MSGQSAISFNCPSCNKSYRVPAEMAGRQAKCKSCGKMMSVPGSKPPEQDSFSALLDKPFSFGQDKEEKQDIKIEKQVPTPKLVKTESGETIVAYDPSTSPAAKKKRAQKKTGFLESFSGMWEALTSPQGKLDEKPALARRISFGGLYLLAGALFTFIYMGISKTDTSGLRLEVDSSTQDQIMGYLPGLLRPIVLAPVLAVAGMLVCARRIWMPRPEKEETIVLIVVGGVMLMLGFVAVYLMFGNYNKAVEMAGLGGWGVLIAAAAFGAWVLYRLGEEGDGSAVYLALIPAFVLPTLAVFKLMSIIPDGRWGDVPWGEVIKYWFLAVLVLSLMGGAMSFFIVIGIVLHILDIGEPPPITAGIRLDMWTLGGLLCLGCYLWLAVTRWRMMMKPVVWQIAIVLVAGTLMGIYHRHAQNEYYAEMSRGFESGNVIITNMYSSDGRLEVIRQDDIPETSRYSSRNNPMIDLNAPRRTGTGRTSTPRVPEAPRLPEPIFSAEDLPRGVDAVPNKGDAWPSFDLPIVNMSQAQAISVWGYNMQLLPGYRVSRMVDEGNGQRKLVIVGPQIEDPSIAFELELLPQDQNDSGAVVSLDWPAMMLQHDIETEGGYVDYGTIDSMQFLRAAPELARYDRYRAGITYLAKMPDSLSRLVLNIPTSGRSLEHLLACEAMARTLERVEPEMGPAMPASADLTLMVSQYSRDVIEATDWDMAGIFAYPQSVSYYTRVDANRPSGMGITFSIRDSNASMTISMEPATPGESREVRVQAQGPEIVQGGDGAFNGRMIYAFGGNVSFDRLWADSVFVRVQRGVTEIDRGQAYELVTYEGWMGSYWTTIRLRRQPNQGLPMSELDSLMRLMRLVNPLERLEERGVQEWLPRMLRSEWDDLPLEGGLTIGEAYELNEIGQAVLSSNIDPETGRIAEIFPLLDAAELEGFASWRADATMLEHLGEPTRVGPVEIRPIAELERSRDSNERQTDWFANTNAGRLGMSMRIDPLREGEEISSVPVSIDPDTGEYVLQIGRRVLRQDADNPPSISYRESRGLRVWRILMPQIPGAETRRCYYVAVLPGQMLSLSATFVRDSAGQLLAMDAMAGSLVHRPIRELE